MRINNTGGQFFIAGKRIPKRYAQMQLCNNMFKVVRSGTMLKLETNVELKGQVELASGNTEEEFASGKTKENPVVWV